MADTEPDIEKEEKVINDRCGSLILEDVDLDIDDNNVKSPEVNPEVISDSLKSIIDNSPESINTIPTNSVEAPIPEAETPILEATITEASKPDTLIPEVETSILEAPIPEAETPILEATITEASKPDTLIPEVETSILEASIPDLQQRPDEIVIPIDIIHDTNSQTSSTQETLGDSILDSITTASTSTTISTIVVSSNANNDSNGNNKIIEDIPESSLTMANLAKLENNITNIIESCLADHTINMEMEIDEQHVLVQDKSNEKVDSNDSKVIEKVIMETNLADKVELATEEETEEKATNIQILEQVKEHDKEHEQLHANIKAEDKGIIIPELEIIELETRVSSINNLSQGQADLNNSLETHKPSVSFSSTDLQDIVDINNLQIHNNLGGNTSSLNTNSEYSYTKRIKDIKQPVLVPKPTHKNIRLSNPLSSNKKKPKKQFELDEVDYLYNKLQDYCRYLTVNISNYMIIITKAMEIIENYEDAKSSSGSAKKENVIKALNRLVMIDLELDEADKKVFLSTVSNYIELIIMRSRRHIKDAKESSKDSFNSKNEKIDEMVLAASGQIVFSLIDKLTTIILKNQYTAEKITHNIPSLTEILMLMADKYVYLTGIEKKNIVLQAINVFIKNKLEYIIDLDAEKKSEIIEILQCVPNTIDLFIALQKQKFKINKKRIIKVRKSGCLTSIFGRKQSYEDE
jgi:hypothetical protein